MKLAIIIPAYNEEKTIKKVLTNLPSKIIGIDDIVSIVIDDGSSDNTFTLAKDYASYAIRHIINLGVGASTITGIKLAKKIKADLVLTMDADNQHNPKDIKKLIKPILDNDTDMVIGVRNFSIKGMPFLKIIGNWVMNIVTFLIFGIWSFDSQSGMKVFNKKVYNKIRLYSSGYEICSEFLGEIKRNKLRFKEVPIDTIYSNYSKRKGQSIINGINIFIKAILIKFSETK